MDHIWYHSPPHPPTTSTTCRSTSRPGRNGTARVRTALGPRPLSPFPQRRFPWAKAGAAHAPSGWVAKQS
eukprot:gene19404-biopygen10027